MVVRKGPELNFTRARVDNDGWIGGNIDRAMNGEIDDECRGLKAVQVSPKQVDVEVDLYWRKGFNYFVNTKWSIYADGTIRSRNTIRPVPGKIPWRRKQQPTPVFLSGKFHGQRSLVGFGTWSRKKSEMTEHTRTLSHTHTFTHTHPTVMKDTAAAANKTLQSCLTLCDP